MKQSFQETGQWWLPLAPNERATGVLIFEPSEGSRLSGVVGGWVGNAAAVVMAEGIFPIAPLLIVGRSDSGALYTCVGNHYGQFFHNEVQGGGALDAADIDVGTVLKGRHFTQLNDVVFRRFSWIYSNLHCWLVGLPGLAIQDVPHEERTYVVRHNRTVLWEAAIAGDFTVSNTYSFQTNRVTHDPNPKLTFSHRDGCLITSQQPRTLDDAFQAEHRFRSLVNLLGDCQLELAEINFNANQAGGPGNVDCFDVRMSGGFAQREDARRGSMPVRFSEIRTNSIAYSSAGSNCMSSLDRLWPFTCSANTTGISTWKISSLA